MGRLQRLIDHLHRFWNDLIEINDMAWGGTARIVREREERTAKEQETPEFKIEEVKNLNGYIFFDLYEKVSTGTWVFIKNFLTMEEAKEMADEFIKRRQNPNKVLSVTYYP